MSRLRNDYEQTAWRRLVHWVEGTAEEKAEAEEQESSNRKTKQIIELHKGKKKQRIRAPILKAKEEEEEEELKRLHEQYIKWSQTRGMKLFQKIYKVMSAVICFSIIMVLLVTVSYLPRFGSASNPDNNEVSARYIEKGLEETGAVNIVTGMILDYRAFDTFGESNVLFISACCVLILLRLDPEKNGKKNQLKLEAEENDRIYEPKNDIILQKIAFLLVPPIIIFGVYVILNGHLSPGGGFSGGAIIGAGLILYLNAFGFKKTERFFTMKTFKGITFGSLAFYALAKGYSFFTGANHMETGIPIGTPGDILSSGLILPLNICVGLVVACTMYSFYTLFRKGGM